LLYSGLAAATSLLPPGFLSVPMLLQDIYYGGIRRLYSWMGYAYWLDQGCASEIISNMIPKDQYGPYKLAAVTMLHAIPGWFGMPDLLPFIPQHWKQFGKGVEAIAVGINFVAGIATRKVNGVSDHMTNEKPLPDGSWAHATQQVIETAKANGNAVILKSGTGTGKTFFFPQETKNWVLGGHIILVPTRVLAETAGVPGSCHVHKRSKVITARVAIMTYGYYRAHHESFDDHVTRGVVQLDELHLQEADQLWALDHCRALDTIRVISTATPELSYVPEEFVTYDTHMPDRHVVKELVVPMCRLIDVFSAVIHDPEMTKRGQNKRVLVIEPSTLQCERFVASVQGQGDAFKGAKIGLMCSTKRTVPPEGYHIVATQMVDTGISIPGVTCVISSGDSVVADKGRVHWSRATHSTEKQRRGRTGRFNEGVYIRTGHELADDETPRYPEVYDGLRNLATWARISKHALYTDLVPWGRIHDLVSSDGYTKWEGRFRNDLVARQSLDLWLNIESTVPRNRDGQLDVWQIAQVYRDLTRGRVADKYEHIKVPSGCLDADELYNARKDARLLLQLKDGTPDAHAAVYRDNLITAGDAKLSLEQRVERPTVDMSSHIARVNYKPPPDPLDKLCAERHEELSVTSPHAWSEDEMKDFGGAIQRTLSRIEFMQEIREVLKVNT